MSKISDAVFEAGMKQTIKDIGRCAGKDLPAMELIKPGKIISVGDLSSDDVGTGARINTENKLDVEYVPVRCWAKYFRFRMQATGDADTNVIYLCAVLDLMDDLADFQEGKYAGNKLLRRVPTPWMDQAVEVLVYAVRDGGYKKWNWLKGMPWSVPVGCAVRHAKSVMVDGKRADEESGLPHVGHIVANLIMLATFYDSYPEGNDMPKSIYFKAQ